MPSGSRGKRRKKEGDPVETEIIVRPSSSVAGRGPGTSLTGPVPVSHCYRCMRKDILVIAVIEARMVGLCPDHFKLDVMTYVP